MILITTLYLGPLGGSGRAAAERLFAHEFAVIAPWAAYNEVFQISIVFSRVLFVSLFSQNGIDECVGGNPHRLSPALFPFFRVGAF